MDPLVDDPWNDKLIDYNTVTFNTLWSSMVTVFEALCLSGWSIQMARQIDAGNGMIAIPFWLLLIFFGSYFILNLNLAVIMDSYTKYEIKIRDDEAKQQEIDRLHSLHHSNTLRI